MNMSKSVLLALPLLLITFCHRDSGRPTAPGIVDADIVTLKAQAAGTVDRFPVGEGEIVGPGALIAEINGDKVANSLAGLVIAERDLALQDERTRARIAPQRANAAYLERQVARFTRLQQNQAAPGETLEKLKVQLLDAQTQLADLNRVLAALAIQRDQVANRRQALEIARRDLAVISPVSGVLLEKYVNPGESVLPGTLIAEVLDTASLTIDVYLEEREIGSLRLGGPARIEIDGPEKRTVTGTIALFGRKAEFSPKYILSEKERQNILYQVKVRVGPDAGPLKVGMPVTVVFL